MDEKGMNVQPPPPPYPQPTPGYQQIYAPPPPQQGGYYPPPQGPPQGPPPAYGQPPPPPPPQAQVPPTQLAGSTSNTFVVNTSPQSVIGMPLIRETPIRCTCPNCKADIVTSTYCDSGNLVWLACLLMFIFGLWLCCFIPFCIDGCKDVVHSCPNCHRIIGRFNRM